MVSVQYMLRTGVALVILGLLIIEADPASWIWITLGSPPPSGPNPYFVLGAGILLAGIVLLFVKSGRKNVLEAPV